MTVSILNGTTITKTELGITQNGHYDLYKGEPVANNSDKNSMRLVVCYKNRLPNLPQMPIRHKMVAFIESSDGNGNWYPLGYQFAPFINEDFGDRHIMIIEPQLFNLEEGSPNLISDGTRIIASESRKQGRVSDEFRIRIAIHENEFDGAYAFESVDITAHYELYNS